MHVYYATVLFAYIPNINAYISEQIACKLHGELTFVAYTIEQMVYIDVLHENIFETL